MATVITSECINCGACEPECPNTAIYQGGVEWELQGVKQPPLALDIFYIVPEKCTECVGFLDHEACAAVCPVDCCVPDPQLPETEEVLIARAKGLHPDTTFSADFPSRFRKAGASAAPPTETSPAPAIKIAVVPPPAAPPVILAPPVAPPPTAAPAQTEPAAPPAPAKEAAAPVSLPPARPAVSAPAPVAAKATVATTAPKARGEQPAPTAKPTPPSKPMRTPGDMTFPGELAGSFDDALAQLGTATGALPARVRTRVARAQALLGALPASQQRAIEQGVGDPACFTARRAMTLNVILNLLLYPLVTAGIGAALLDRAVWSRDAYAWVGVGIALALLEALFRLREGALQALPTERWKCRGSGYGWLLAKFVAPFVRQLLPVTTEGTVAVNGFHGEGFEDKLERERRYGEVYSLKEQGNGYLLRFEFPRRVPQSAAKEAFGIPDTMPDYDYALSFRNGVFVVQGHVRDRDLRRLAAVSPGFPPDFTTTVQLPKPARTFKHRLRDKTLEVVLLRQ